MLMTRSSIAKSATVLFVLGHWSCTTPTRPSEPPKTQATSGQLISYRPPEADAPLSRVVRLPRGSSVQLPNIVVLVPEQVGYTAKEQPVLFWFASAPTKVTCDISIIDVSALRTVFQTSFPGIDAAGIQKIDLAIAKPAVRLRPNSTYQLLVALCPDAAAPAKNVDAGGLIKCVALPKEVEARASAENGAQRAKIYAEAGWWFDALSTLSESVESDPTNKSLRELRASLLRQVNLDEAAEFESGKSVQSAPRQSAGQVVGR